MGDSDRQDRQFRDSDSQRRSHKKDAASSYQLNSFLYDQGSVNERLAQGLTTSEKEHKKKLKENMENLQQRIDGGVS